MGASGPLGSSREDILIPGAQLVQHQHPAGQRQEGALSSLLSLSLAQVLSSLACGTAQGCLPSTYPRAQVILRLTWQWRYYAPVYFLMTMKGSDGYGQRFLSHFLHVHVLFASCLWLHARC